MLYPLPDPRNSKDEEKGPYGLDPEGNKAEILVRISRIDVEKMVRKRIKIPAFE